MICQWKTVLLPPLVHVLMSANRVMLCNVGFKSERIIVDDTSNLKLSKQKKRFSSVTEKLSVMASTGFVPTKKKDFCSVIVKILKIRGQPLSEFRLPIDTGGRWKKGVGVAPRDKVKN